MISQSKDCGSVVFVYNGSTMSTLQINLSEPLQQFVAGRVAELGLERADQYFEQLLEVERKKRLSITMKSALRGSQADQELESRTRTVKRTGMVSRKESCGDLKNVAKRRVYNESHSRCPL